MFMEERYLFPFLRSYGLTTRHLLCSGRVWGWGLCAEVGKAVS